MRASRELLCFIRSEPSGRTYHATQMKRKMVTLGLGLGADKTAAIECLTGAA
jgi:hypothetical protein